MPALPLPRRTHLLASPAPDHSSSLAGLRVDEFILHYQPKLDLVTDRICGVEALLRWNHPTDGLLAPDNFLHSIRASGGLHSVERWVVTSPDRHEVIRLAEACGCKVLLLRSAGMGDSIAAAVAASAAADGWLVVLGDMPFIQSSTIERVIDALEDINVPLHAGQYGHPVAFAHAFGPALMALSGDRGAKPLFAEAQLREVWVDDPGVLWDVDVPERLDFKHS